MCVAIVCKPGFDVMNFEVKFIFLIKPFFLNDLKVATKPVSAVKLGDISNFVLLFLL